MRCDEGNLYGEAGRGTVPPRSSAVSSAVPRSSAVSSAVICGVPSRSSAGSSAVSRSTSAVVHHDTSGSAGHLGIGVLVRVFGPGRSLSAHVVLWNEMVAPFVRQPRSFVQRRRSWTTSPRESTASKTRSCSRWNLFALEQSVFSVFTTSALHAFGRWV